VGRQLPRRRDFLRMTGIMAGAGMVGFKNPLSPGATVGLESFGASSSQSESNRPDYVLRISASPVEIAPKHISAGRPMPWALTRIGAVIGDWPSPVVRRTDIRARAAARQVDKGINSVS